MQNVLKIKSHLYKRQNKFSGYTEVSTNEDAVSKILVLTIRDDIDISLGFKQMGETTFKHIFAMNKGIRYNNDVCRSYTWEGLSSTKLGGEIS